jgi:hypothetical protein
MSKYGSPEQYSRFLRKDWLKKDNTRVHWKAYYPDQNNINSRLEVSCYETQNMNLKEIIDIAEKNNIRPNSKFPLGHSTIIEKDFPINEVDIEKNYIPERHIDIIGWDRFPNYEDKKLIASLLAEKATNDIIIY